MLKRTREETPKAQPMSARSALAQRRLAATKTPETPIATPSPAPASPVQAKKTTPNLVAPTPQKLRHPASQQLQNELLETERERNEFQQKRQEIEARMAARNQSIKRSKRNSNISVIEEADEEMKDAPEPEAAAEAPATLTPVKEKKAKKLVKKQNESALERMKRERAEREAELQLQIEEQQADDVAVQSAAISEPEDKEDADVVMEESSTPSVSQISNFTPTEETCTIGDISVTFRLRSDESLVLAGIYRMVVLEGTVTVSGAICHASSRQYTIYAPTTQALPVVEALPNAAVPKKRSKSKPTVFDAVVLITSYHSSILDIGKLCPTFNNIWNISTTPTSKYRGFSFQPVYTSTGNIQALEVPPSWEDTLAYLAPEEESVDSEVRRILIAGSKGTGKSTFSRLLVNRIVSTTSSVAYLDIDPGQPTFSPPGCVALHLIVKPILGPSFTTSSISPIRSHHIGYISPKSDPGHYMACISDLFATYRSQYPSTPLVINTAGWTKGLGLELLQDILDTSAATDVITLGSLLHPNPLAELTIPDSTILQELTNVPVRENRFSAADHRAIQTISYFHHRFTECGESDWNFSKPLTGVAPWTVPYRGAERGIDAVCILGEQILPELITTAIEGTIVGVVTVQDAGFPADQVREENGYPPMILSEQLPAPAMSECAGLAVVRAVDMEKGQVELVTSITEEQMEGWEKRGCRVVLVRGRVELPVWEMVVRGREKETAPWVSFGSGIGGEGKGGAVWRVRRNVMRKAHGGR